MSASPSTGGLRVAVLVPCMNEEQAVAKVVGDYRRLLPDADIYVFDNASTDKTAELARSAGACVIHEPRRGKGNVIRSMFRLVEADAYLMVDGDDTYAADDVVALLGPIVSGEADMVVGDRLSSTYFDVNTRPMHGLGNRIVRQMINTIFRARLNDIMSGGRAFSPLFVRSYPAMGSGFEVETEMTVHALDKRFVVKEMPVGYRERGVGSSSKLRTVPDGIRVIKTVVALFKDHRPMLFSALVFLALFALSSVMFIVPFREYVTTGYVRKVPTLVVSMALGTTALLALATGVVLDAIRKQSRMLYELELNHQARLLGITIKPGGERSTE